MENTVKTPHQMLRERIEKLKVLKAHQEVTISKQFTELVGNINTETIIKDSIMHLVTNKGTQKDLLKMAASEGANYVIEKFLGSNNSIKRYLGSLLAEKVSNSFIGNMISKF